MSLEFEIAVAETVDKTAVDGQFIRKPTAQCTLSIDNRINADVCCISSIGREGRRRI